MRSLPCAAMAMLFLSLGILAASRTSAIGDEGQTADLPDKAAALEKDVTQGALRIVGRDGTVLECPLKHTDVQAEVSGFIARVKVVQTFHNPTTEKIEAVYVFPLPHEAAVDDMTMKIGDRKIVGLIKRRADARTIYENALAAGQTAALLEQERPNIFTQSVGNITPGQEIRIEISYVDTLRYDMGTYEFHFPMVVGPRYNPGSAISSPAGTAKELEGKVSPPASDTSRVPDASRISPPVLKPGYRNGHDVSLSVKLDAGVPIQDLKVANHQAAVDRSGDHKATVSLDKADSVPNKDFVLRYSVVGQKPSMALLTHTGDYAGDAARLGSGYFMLMIQPKEDERLAKSPPREVVFLIDVSGSMSGEPTAKNVEIMQNMLRLCREKDTVQVIVFENQAYKLFDKAVPVTDANIKRALGFTSALRGGGGTEMLKGVQMAIDEPLDKERMRIVVMLTDGYIGNEAEIIEYVGKHCGDQVRFWCLGIGSAPNMFLVDGVAKQGGGMGKKLGLKDDSPALAQEVMSRIQRAQLAKLKIDWGGLKVAETFPAKLPELWAGRPVIVYGRYSGSSDNATVNVSGNVEGEAVSWPVAVTLPAKEPGHDVLAKVWARQKVEDLMQQTFYQGSPAVEEEVTAIALQYRLMSQYTSFVAVDSAAADKLDAPPTPPRRMSVPVPLPEGARWEGFFGGEEHAEPFAAALSETRGVAALAPSRPMPAKERELGDSRLGVGGGFGFAGPRRDQVQSLEGRGFRSRASGRGDIAYPLVKPSYARATERTEQSAAPGLGLGGGAGNGSGGGRHKPHLNVTEKLDKEFDLKRNIAHLSKLQDETLDREETVYSDAVIGPVYGGKAEAVAKQAAASWEAAEKMAKSPDLAAYRAALLQAYLLDSAALNLGGAGGTISAAALAAIEDLHARQIDAWSKGLKGGDARLDLVIRDQPLDAALAMLAKVSGQKIELIEGSLGDALALLDRKDLRIEYLDLRRATVAQALDWLLEPLALTWRCDQGRFVVGSERRMPGQSAWVYQVANIALPTVSDLKATKNEAQVAASVQTAVDGFLAAIRADLGLIDDAALVWFAPGQLLLTGSHETHAHAAKLFSDLADPKAKVTGQSAKLHKLAIARAAAAKPAQDKRIAARQLQDVASLHEAFGWELLADAAAGKLNDEAVTELEIAWKSPDTQRLLAGELPGLALRSWWIVQECAGALPKEPRLQALAALAKGKSHKAAETALAALEKNPEDAVAFSSVLYAALAQRGEQAFQSKALPLLSKSGDSPMASARIIATALLGKADGGALRKILAAPPQGEDMTVLLAMACRCSGGETWSEFRASAHDLLGGQPLAGGVVLLINRLAAPRLPWLAARN